MICGKKLGDWPLSILFKADDIQTIEMSREADHIYGNMYLIEGNTATNLNFYLTDSSKHFF